MSAKILSLEQEENLLKTHCHCYKMNEGNCWFVCDLLTTYIYNTHNFSNSTD